MASTRRATNVKTYYFRRGDLAGEDHRDCPNGIWKEVTKGRQWSEWTWRETQATGRETPKLIYWARQVEKSGILGREKREPWKEAAEDTLPEAVVTSADAFGGTSARTSGIAAGSPVVIDDAATENTHISNNSDGSRSSEASSTSSSSEASEKSFTSLPSNFKSAFPRHDPERTKLRLRDRSLWGVARDGILRHSKLPPRWREWNQHFEEWIPGADLQPGRKSLWKWAGPMMNREHYAARARAAQAQAAQAQAANNAPPRRFANVGSAQAFTGSFPANFWNARTFTGAFRPAAESAATSSDTRSSVETDSRSESSETHGSTTHSSETQSYAQFSHQPGYNADLWTEDRHQRYINAIDHAADQLQDRLNATDHKFIEFVDVLGVANSFQNWQLRDYLPTAPVYGYDPSLPRNVRRLAEKILRQAAKAVGWNGRGLYYPFDPARLEWVFRARRVGPILKTHIDTPREEWKGAVLLRAYPAIYWLIKQDCLQQEFHEDERHEGVRKERRVLIDEIDRYMQAWAGQMGERRVTREMRRDLDAYSNALGIKYTDDMWEFLYREYKDRRNIH
ncbi:MAG: hypothetical protein Q9159_002042 [Coniocarpon cinnabarinum]